MDASENRQIGRDSLFLMAAMRVDGMEGEFRIKVRNLSAGGMMGDGDVRVVRGALVSIDIRNVGWVEGTVAWVQDSRFGVAFRDEIDPKLARLAASDEGEHTARYLRPALPFNAPGGRVRKI